MMPSGPNVRTQPATRPAPLHRRYRPVAAAPGRRAWPAGLLGTAVLVGCAEAWLARQGTRFNDPVSACCAFSAAEAAGAKAKGADVLFAGDSLVKHGLFPAVVSRSTGRPAYNLAVAAGPSPITYVILRRALDAGARPSAVVFDLKPSLLVGGPKYSLRAFQQVLGPREVLGLARASGNGEFAAGLFLGSLLTSYRARHDVRADVLAALDGKVSRTQTLNAIGLRNWSVNLGANVATPNPGFGGAVPESEHEALLSDRFHPHRVNDQYARATAGLLADRGINAYLLIAPLSPAVTERRRRAGTLAKYEAYVRGLQAKYPGLTVLDASAAGYPASVFVDPIHLDARGASTLSADVAEVLRGDAPSKALPASRWVTLPPYREVAAGVTLEDVEHSRERLGVAPFR